MSLYLANFMFILDAYSEIITMALSDSSHFVPTWSWHMRLLKTRMRTTVIVKSFA